MAPNDASSVPPLPLSTQSRLDEIRVDISTRLGPVNVAMSRASFNELMDKMSRLQLRFELRSAGTRGQVYSRYGPGDRRAISPALLSTDTPPSAPRVIPIALPPPSSTPLK